MKLILPFTLFYSIAIFTSGQGISKSDWYSESNTNGIVIQNSFPRGGPYAGPTIRNFNHTHLVFFTRVVNETKSTLELRMDFSADSIPIPNSPDTFVKLFLPPDTMTHAKRSVFDYGVVPFRDFEKPTTFQKTMLPGEECLFLVEAIFYQTSPSKANRDRGGNRAELVLRGQNLFYKMPPQVDLLPCGQIVFKN